jgi:hypothetical protein
MLFCTRSNCERNWPDATGHISDVGSQTDSTQAAQAIHFNATTGYQLTRGIWLGANGYYLDQITNPQINGHSLSSSPEQVGAIAPGVVWDLGHWILYANGYHEVGALNRPEGNRAVLRVQWLPSRKGRQL